MSAKNDKATPRPIFQSNPTLFQRACRFLGHCGWVLPMRDTEGDVGPRNEIVFVCASCFLVVPL